MRNFAAACTLSTLLFTGCSSDKNPGEPEAENSFYAVSRQVLLSASYIEAPEKGADAQIRLAVRIHTIRSGGDGSSTSIVSLPTLVVTDGGKSGGVSVIGRSDPDSYHTASVGSPHHLEDFGVSILCAARRSADGKIHVEISKLWRRESAHPEQPAFEIAWQGDVIPDKEVSIYSTQDIR